MICLINDWTFHLRGEKKKKNPNPALIINRNWPDVSVQRYVYCNRIWLARYSWDWSRPTLLHPRGVNLHHFSISKQQGNAHTPNRSSSRQRGAVLTLRRSIFQTFTMQELQAAGASSAFTFRAPRFKLQLLRFLSFISQSTRTSKLIILN